MSHSIMPTTQLEGNWKILKQMAHLTCLLRNLYAGQEATEPDMEKQTGSKLGKEYRQYCMLSPCLFNLPAEYTMQNARLDKSNQTGIKIAGRNINDLRYADNTTLMSK